MMLMALQSITSMLFFVIWIGLPFIIGLLTYGLLWAIVLAVLGYIASLISMVKNVDSRPNHDYSVMVVSYILLGLVIFFYYQHNQTVTQERQNCIQQQQSNSTAVNPAGFCSGLTSSELDQEYPLTAN